MENAKLRRKIMHEITAEEEKRLKKLLLVAGPFVLVSFLVICFMTHRTVSRMIENEFFKAAFDFKSGKELIVSHLVECLTLFWFVIEKATLIILIICYIILTIILLKTDFFSSSNRIKKIKKFKSETFSHSPRNISREDKNGRKLSQR